MDIVIEKHQIAGRRGGISISIPGFEGDPTAIEAKPSQIYIEYYNGKLLVHVWTGEPDPQTIEILPLKG